MKNKSAQLRHTLLRPVGIEPDLLPWESADNVWSIGFNCRFADGITESMGGRRQRFAPTQTEPHFATNLQSQASNFVLWADTDKMYRIEAGGAIHDNVTIAGGLTPVGYRDWFGFSTNRLGYMCNGIEAPMFVRSNPAPTAAEAWPDWVSYFGIDVPTEISALNNFLFAAGTVLEPETVFWSGVYGPGEPPAIWEPALSNRAGAAFLGDTAGGITAALPLDDKLIVYKTHSAYTLLFLGGTFVWGQRKMFDNIGVLNRDAVVEYAGKHIILADGDVLEHDGARVRSLAGRKIRRHIFNSIADMKGMQLVINQSRAEMWLLHNGNGAPRHENEVAFVYDIQADVWGSRELGKADGERPVWSFGGFVPDEGFELTWDEATSSWNDSVRAWNQYPLDATREGLFMCEPDGFYVYDDGGQHTEDGLVIDMRKEGIELGANDYPQQFKVVRRVVINGDLSVAFGFEIRVGHQNQRAEPVKWGDWRSLTTSRTWTGFERGRFHAINIRETTGAWTRIHSFNVEWTLEGDE